MAAGAIPPPLFFEQRRSESVLASAHGILKNPWKYNQRPSPFDRPARSSPTTRAMTAEG
jgi:hypothetical protein